MAKLSELKELETYLDDLDTYFETLLETEDTPEVPEELEFDAKELGELLQAEFDDQLTKQNSQLRPGVGYAKIGYALIKLRKN